MMTTIRLATENDFGKIHALNRQFADFIKTPEKFKITVAQMKAEKNLFKMLVLEDEDGEIIGFATTFIAWYSWVGKTFYLDDIYVKEKFRHLGLGSKIMEEVIKMAREAGCKKIRWQVSEWNENAINFYKKLGAEIDDVERNCDLWLS
jgi:GNAT superfamily N-acetyltransferase